ncbi:hypothetical protein SISSUDRAFT_1101765 [Sistotremastrum suecicum HHB10207 ss-3]|uniref:Uncharacterized protein n=1 Tax=Sistotremastrum suecicum HHB10207 ss-3 TaxID=1314776 RepID=A0A166DK18_9AGAM|nr:hypothetical protein SISSUDRAFT_1101765 [Sistotremastrum suecicum HHB10207 ss-3]
MPIFEDFEVWIEIDDERLAEHVVKFEDLRKKSFEICVVDSRLGRNNLVYTDIFLDVKQQTSTRRTGEIKASVGFLRDARKTAPLKITPRPIPSHFASREYPEDGSIGHLAKLGDPVPLSSDLERVSTVVLTNLPTFEFIFSYAPEHLLRSMSIMEPLPPSDPPSPMTSIGGEMPETEENDQTMTDDDCTYLDSAEALLYRQLREKIATRRRIAAQIQHSAAGSGLHSDGYTSLL